MKNQSEFAAVREIIDKSKHIVVVQADNPDSDSLASSLAIEQILGELGKQVDLYCGVDIPSYLKYLPGSDRVRSELPNQFDASVIVDTNSLTLLEQLVRSGAKSWLASRPAIVIDHHSSSPTIDFAVLVHDSSAVATGEILYELSQKLNWPLNDQARQFIAIAILSDSLGLTTENTSARSVHILAELVEAGVKLAEIENARRETMRREAELVHYKGRLLQRVEFHDGGRIATVSIPWGEIESYSPLYNPSMLVIDDMRLAKGTDVAICFKQYPDGKVTAKIRCNYRRGIADKLAECFGGGGHPYASGFKINDGRKLQEIKADAIALASSLLDELETKAEK